MNTILPFILAKKKFVIIGLILILLIVGRTVLLSKPTEELTYTVKKESLVDTVQVSGTYTTAAQTEVTSPAKGILTELFVVNNDEVKKGDPLFHVESTATSEEKAAAQADYQNALSNLKTAQQAKEAADATMWTEHTALLNARNSQKYKNENSQNPSTNKDYTEFEKQSIDASVVQAEKDFKVTEKKYNEADSTIAAEQADLNKAQLALAATQSITVKAPASGTVANLQKQVGDQVKAGSSATSQTLALLSGQQVESAPPVLYITDFGNPALTVSINEAYIPRIESGQKATVTFDGLKDKEFHGVIQSIDAIGTKTNGIVSYNARITISDLTENIRPNMSGLVTIETLREDNVMTVPNSAIITKDGKTYVQKANTKDNALIEVTLGTKGTSKTEVTDGLTEGMVIAADPSSE